VVLGVGNGSAVAHPSDQLKELDMNARILSITAAAAIAIAALGALQSQPSAQPEHQPRAGEAGQAGHAGGHTGDPAAVASQALPAGFSAEPVLKTSETRDGDMIVFPGGTPEITSVIGTIEAGGRTPLHQHPIPVYVYVLEGAVELETEGGEPKQYRQGEAYIEALNRNHQLFNRSNAPSKVLVVFIGEQGTPTTVATTQ
jgi:quercetin dioxygenase-like cupin family protein